MKDIWEWTQLEVNAFVFTTLFVPMGLMFLLMELAR